MTSIADTPENLQKCICGDCPTYNKCMRDKMQGLFCAKEKSDCEISRNGCLCGACPIASDNRLDKMYYCVSGAA